MLPWQEAWEDLFCYDCLSCRWTTCVGMCAASFVVCVKHPWGDMWAATSKINKCTANLTTSGKSDPARWLCFSRALALWFKESRGKKNLIGWQCMLILFIVCTLALAVSFRRVIMLCSQEFNLKIKLLSGFKGPILCKLSSVTCYRNLIQTFTWWIRHAGFFFFHAFLFTLQTFITFIHSQFNL